jgi:hypothetical protein
MRFTLESTYDENGRKQIYNLGADILTYACTGEGELFEGKILLIGDWTENDMHDTIRAEQPGIAVLYNAYLLLRDEKNTLPWYLLLILLLLFWGVAATAIWNKSDYLSRQMERIQLFLNKHRILKVCLRFVSVMLVLQLICIFTYFVFGRYINILTIGIILTLISFFL